VEDVNDFILGENEEKFMKSFLYCVLRWGYSGIGVLDSCSGKGNFEDFLERADDISKNANYKEVDFLYEERYLVPNDPFYIFNDLYVKVMKEPASLSAKEEPLIEMRKKYAAEIEEIEKQWAESENEWGEVDEHQLFFDDTDELSRIQQDLYNEEEKEIERFVNREVFAEQYRLFRELYFQMDEYLLNRMKYIIEGMLDIYLYQKNLSNFLDDELFFKTFAMLRKTTNHVQKYLPEEVK